MDLSDTYKIFDEPKPVNSANHSRSSKNQPLLEMHQQDLKEEKEKEL